MNNDKVTIGSLRFSVRSCEVIVFIWVVLVITSLFIFIGMLIFNRFEYEEEMVAFTDSATPSYNCDWSSNWYVVTEEKGITAYNKPGPSAKYAVFLPQGTAFQSTKNELFEIKLPGRFWKEHKFGWWNNVISDSIGIITEYQELWFNTGNIEYLPCLPIQ